MASFFILTGFVFADVYDKHSGQQNIHGHSPITAVA